MAHLNSEEFRQWLIAVDDDETEIEDLYKEFLMEKLNNQKSQKMNLCPMEENLEQKLKELLISTYEKKVGVGQMPLGYNQVIGKLTIEELIEEIKNDTEVGIQCYKSIISLTIDLLLRDKIHIDRRREEKINQILNERESE
jgi:hypothetical protein